jgi:hypothetical protein
LQAIEIGNRKTYAQLLTVGWNRTPPEHVF